LWPFEVDGQNILLTQTQLKKLRTKKTMKGPMRTMNRLRLQSESGFTLIELLVVVAIIGILAAIAIPQFAAYRKRGHEAQVKSDLRNAAVSQEAYFAQYSTYISATPLTNSNAPGFNPTSQVTVNAARGTNTFLMTATHVNCSGVNWTFSSTSGSISGPAGGCP
jgi:type IV pilus assembly protein PilA